MSFKLWGLIIAIGALPLMWNGCSKFGTSSDAAEALFAQGNTQPPMAATSGAAAFQSGFYAFVNNQGCVQCHGANVNPKFASSDVASAYAVAKGPINGSNAPLIDFNDPDGSIFITYAGNGHCNALPCSDPNVRPQIKSLLEAWAAAELGENGGGGGSQGAPKMYVTASLPIPADLPVLTAGNPVIMRFDLSKLSPTVAALSGAVFEVSIQKANPTEYRLVNPRLGGNKQTVTVKGIHLYVRSASESGLGVEDNAQGSVWTTVEASVAPSTLPASGPLTTTPLSTATLFIQAQSTSDVLTIGFESF